jgi:hypothetical protein
MDNASLSLRGSTAVAYRRACPRFSAARGRRSRCCRGTSAASLRRRRRCGPLTLSRRVDCWLRACLLALVESLGRPPTERTGAPRTMLRSFVMLPVSLGSARTFWRAPMMSESCFCAWAPLSSFESRSSLSFCIRSSVSSACSRARRSSSSMSSSCCSFDSATLDVMLRPAVEAPARPLLARADDCRPMDSGGGTPANSLRRLPVSLRRDAVSSAAASAAPPSRFLDCDEPPRWLLRLDEGRPLVTGSVVAAASVGVPRFPGR